MPARSVPPALRPSSPFAVSGEAAGRSRSHRRRPFVARTVSLAAIALVAFGPSSRADDRAAAGPAERRAAPTATSDLLVVLGGDGQPLLVQHTLASEGALVRLDLPEGTVPERTRFAGPERATFAEAHRRAPGRVTLWSGSAIVRHRARHPLGTLETDAAGVSTLAASSIPDGLRVEDGELAASHVTWVFPETLELLSFTSAADAPGRWQAGDDRLSFEQVRGESASLRLRWRRRSPPADPPTAGGTSAEVAVTACADTYPLPDACAADVDGDGVPDHRDVCLRMDGEPAPSPGAGDAASRTDALGCPAPAYDARPVRVLDGIAFPAGQSYLDVTARELLDRVAGALEHIGEGTWEIAAHTDGTGSRARNRRLSETRAEAVRHYLMLRGIGPNRLRARGYGETRPIGDDRTADGRRANRRIEIERID